MKSLIRIACLTLIFPSMAWAQGSVPPVNLGGSQGVAGGQSDAGSITLSSMTDADYTLHVNEWWAGQLEIPSSLTLTAIRTITAPSNAGQFYNSICNHSSGGFSVKFKASGQASPVVVPSATCLPIVYDSPNYILNGTATPSILPVTCTSSCAFTAAGYTGFSATLTQSFTSSTIASAVTGQTYTFTFTQDATGGRNCTYPSGTVGASPCYAVANGHTQQRFFYNGSNLISNEAAQYY